MYSIFRHTKPMFPQKRPMFPQKRPSPACVWDTHDWHIFPRIFPTLKHRRGAACFSETLGAFEKVKSLNIHVYICVYIYTCLFCSNIPLLQKYWGVLLLFQPLVPNHWVLSRKGKVSTYICTYIYIYIYTCLFCRNMPVLQKYWALCSLFCGNIGCFRERESLNIHTYTYTYIYTCLFCRNMPLLQKYWGVLLLFQPLVPNHWVLSRKGKVSTYIRTHIHIHASFAETCLFCKSIARVVSCAAPVAETLGAFEKGESLNICMHIWLTCLSYNNLNFPAKEANISAKEANVSAKEPERFRESEKSQHIYAPIDDISFLQ